MSLLEGMAGARAGGGTDAGVKQMQTKKSFHARLYYVSLLEMGSAHRTVDHAARMRVRNDESP